MYYLVVYFYHMQNIAPRKQRQNVLITGSTGFLGTALLKTLQTNEQYRIYTTDNSLHDLTKIEECLVATKKIDIIINLAGLVLSRKEQKTRPAEVFAKNVLIDLNIAEAARQNNVRRILFIGSITAYPENISAPFSENDLWNGPVADASYAYGSAKRVTEIISRTHSDQYGIETTTLFLPNLYGPGDKFDYSPPPLIPSIIIQIRDAVLNEAPTIHGGNNGDSRLDLLYVADAADAIKHTLDVELLPATLNIGTGTTISIKEMYETVAKIFRYTGIIEWQKGNVSPPRAMDATRAHKQIGWHSTTSFETGISNTISNFLKK